MIPNSTLHLIQESKPALASLKICIREIRNWIDKDYLKLYDSKTEFVIILLLCDLLDVLGGTITVCSSQTQQGTLGQLWIVA